MKSKKGKIVTITSTKGGVGKTILSLNLAGVYSSLGYKVLIVDLDLYGGAIATYFNSNNDKTIYNLVEDLTNNRYEKVEDYIYSYSNNIDIVSAPKDPRMANKIDSKYIPLLFRNVIYKYDVVLVDTSHILNEINIVTLDNSDSILYVFTNDTFDLKNTKSFISIMKDVGYDNFFTILNESNSLRKGYYSLFDIRNIIKNNIDYNLSSNFYIKNLDKYILNSEIPVLNKGFDKKSLTKLSNLALKLIDNKEEIQ